MWARYWCVQGASGTVEGFLLRKWLFVVHHLVVGLGMLPVVLFTDKGQFFVGCFGLFELSNCFVHIRWLLKHAGLEHSRLYLANGA